MAYETTGEEGDAPAGPGFGVHVVLVVVEEGATFEGLCNMVGQEKSEKNLETSEDFESSPEPEED